ncbi:MAG: hypothetical protein GY953_14715, partial [bacterium]|nr:hypothetical protein [bacterium]
MPLIAASRRGRVFRAESSTNEDPATGFEVTRLTDPAYSSHLPNSHYRFISSKHNFLLYSSDRGGTMQAFRLDLNKDQHRQITAARNLDPGCLTLFGNDKSFAFIDGGVLFQAGSKGGKPRKLFEAHDGWQLSGGLDIDPDGRTGALAETRAGVSRLLLLDVKRRKAAPVTEQDGVLSNPMLRPGHHSILYRSNRDELWMVNHDGNSRRRLNLPPGRLGPIYWVAGAGSFHYLSIPEGGNLPAIHQYWIEEE